MGDVLEPPPPLWLYDIDVYDESGDKAVMVARFSDIEADSEDNARAAALAELSGADLTAWIVGRRRVVV